jgi:hypothetical protein
VKLLHPLQIENHNLVLMEGEKAEESDSVEQMSYLVMDSSS